MQITLFSVEAEVEPVASARLFGKCIFLKKYYKLLGVTVFATLKLVVLP